ncbi:hypothetical protein [Wolbachia endosymbiont of Onchocerca volvulus]
MVDAILGTLEYDDIGVFLLILLIGKIVTHLIF